MESSISLQAYDGPINLGASGLERLACEARRRNERQSDRHADTRATRNSIFKGVMWPMKAQRQAMILRIIADHVIETQDDLVAALCAQGLSVTQATISRDIKELRLVKVATSGGAYRYSASTAHSEADYNVGERAQRAFDDYVLAVQCTHNLVLIKTLPGAASAVAAFVDELGIDGILGTIAGDDAILVVTKDAEPAPPPTGPTAHVYDELLQLARGRR